MQSRKQLLLATLVIVFCLIFFLYSYFISKSSKSQEPIAMESMGIVVDIAFVPKHEEQKQVAYKTGKYSVRYQTHTSTIPDAYSLTLHVKGIDNLQKYSFYNLSQGQKLKQGDKVQVWYKRIEASLFWQDDIIYITEIKVS